MCACNHYDNSAPLNILFVYDLKENFYQGTQLETHSYLVINLTLLIGNIENIVLKKSNFSSNNLQNISRNEDGVI